MSSSRRRTATTPLTSLPASGNGSTRHTLKARCSALRRSARNSVAGTMSSLNGRRNTAISSARSTRRPRHSSLGCPPGHKLRVSLRPHWLSSLLTQPTISSSPSPPPMRAPSSLMKPRGPAHASESRFLTPAEDLKSIGSTPLKCYVAPVSPLVFPALPTKSKRGTSNQPVTNASTRLEMQHSPTPPAHE